MVCAGNRVRPRHPTFSLLPGEAGLPNLVGASQNDYGAKGTLTQPWRSGRDSARIGKRQLVSAKNTNRLQLSLDYFINLTKTVKTSTTTAKESSSSIDLTSFLKRR